MRHPYLWSSLFLLFFLFSGFRQPEPENFYCASDFINYQYRLAHPETGQLQQVLEKSYQLHAGSDQPESFPYTLPVVFHIIHNNGPENLADALVLQGLQQLNDAFANVGYYDPATGVNTEIQFCLAKQDPDGLFTTGINHVVSPLTNMSMESDDLALKDLIRWDPLHYINIWVVGEICSNSLGCGVAGYAFFPASHGSDEDGIVVEAAFLGSSPANSGVLVHEMGHYLGLYHTFEGGCANDDCLADGDRVCDTPPDQSTAPVPCANPTNSCTTDTDSGFAADQNDMIINYMDYGDLDCYSAFTPGQKDRMGFFIEGARSSLLDSPGCNDPCLVPITAGFTPSSILVDVGNPVTFTNTTTGATVFEWQLDGVPFANTVNASYTFSAEGTYLITLIATNADPNCYETYSVEITVTCPVSAQFAASSTEVTPGTVVFFTNLSQNATQYQWYLDGVLQSNAVLWSNLFSNNGTFDVQLVASNGNCSDTSAITVITVSATGLAQTGLPVWPLASNAGQLSQTIDWQQQPPDIAPIPNGVSLTPGSTGAAFDGCGDLVFYALHTGSGNPNNLFLYAPDGTELLSNSTANGPGLNGVKGGQEIQVVRVPQEQNEWYIIYRQWSTDATAPAGSAAYTPAPFLYSRVRLDGNGLTVLQKDILLTDLGGASYTYNDGAAVSRTAAGDVNAHFLYLARRALNGNTLSLDRFLINNTGITFSANTGTVPATYWNLTHAGSHIELSPTEDRIAVCNRNQFNNYQDYFIFDAVAFSNAAVQVITAENLYLVADGTANDQSNVLPVGGTIQSIANNTGLPLRFLQNFNKKLAPLEFSPNGRFLYVTAGGYASAGFSNITYLAQIDLESSPLEVRLQVQTTPGSTYNTTTGAGCALANCSDDWREIGEIESAFDGNLYFVKRNDNTLYVIPDPNNVMPQNLVPSDIDLSTPAEPNLVTNNVISSLPDPIDGFNYFLSQFQEVAIPVGGEDCDGCRAPFEVQVLQSGEVVETFTVASCPDTLYFCADTSLVYQLFDPVLGIAFDSAVIQAQTNLPPDSTAFQFSDMQGCTEICGNNIDDDNDGLVDCADPDLFGDCCCATVLSLDLGPDIVLCENGVVALDAGPGFDTYLWPDLSVQQTFTVYGPGTFWVLATDSCGSIYTDTLVITVDPGTELDLGPDRTYCANDPGTVFSLSGFAGYQWYPDTGLDCDTCAVVTAQPAGPTSYIVVAETPAGCYSVDTVVVTPLDTVLVHWDTLVCENEVVLYNGQNLPVGSSTPFVFQGANGCDSTVVVMVGALPKPEVSAVVQDISCFGELDGAIDLQSADPDIQYSLDGGPFQPVNSFSGLGAGTYQIEYAAGNGCEFSLPPLEVVEPPEVVVYLPADTSIQQGQSIGIAPIYNDQPGLSFGWTPPGGLNCPVCPEVVASPPLSTVYTLTVQSPGGCTAADSILIEVLFDRKVFIPNTFSPNFDGINDYFLPFTGPEAVAIRTFRIFDRWGGLIFERLGASPDAKDLGWDGTLGGKPMPAGVYAYYVEVEFGDGEVVLYKGGVQLIR